MTTPDVRVRLSAEGVAEVVSALKKVQAEGDKTGKAGRRSFLDLNSVLGGTANLLGTLGIALGVGSFIHFIRNSAEAADELGRLGQKVGASVENLSALNLAATTSHVNMEALGKGLVFMNRHLAEFANGSPPAVAMFRKLGLSVADFKGKDAAQAFDLVSQRIVKLGDGAQKTLSAVQVFGRGGAQLVPVMNELAEQGLANVIERARELGVLFDHDMVAAAQELTDDFRVLKLQAQGLGVQFATGLAPSVSQALQIMSGDLSQTKDAWKSFGEGIGTVVKFIVAVVSSAFDVVGTLLAEIMIAIDSLVRASARVIKGDLPGALQALRFAANTEVKETEKLLDRLKGRFELAFQAPPPAKTREATQTDLESDPAELARKQAEAAKAIRDAELTYLKAQLKARLDAEKRSFEQGTSDLRKYYDERRRIITQEADAEVASLLARKALLSTEDDQVKAQAEAKSIDVQVNKVRLEQEGSIAALTFDETEALREMGKKALAIEQKILEAKGKRHEAALLGFAEEIREADLLYRKQGLSDQERLAKIEQLRASLTAGSDFEEAQNRAQQSMADLGLERARIDAQIQVGQITQLDGERQILALERERIGVLQEAAKALLAAAEATGDPQKIQQAREFAQSVDEIGVSATHAENAMVRFRDALEQSSLQALTDFLADGITEAKNFGNAVRQMAASVVQSIRRIAAEMLAAKIIKGIFSLFGEGGQVGGGSGESHAGGGRVMATRGSLGRAHRFSSGGFLQGPGTGTSDNLVALTEDGRPVRLSNGEFVVRAAAVQQPGALEFLQAFNRWSMATLKPIAPSAPRFAGGGLIEKGAATSDRDQKDGRLLIGLEEGLVLRHLETSAGQRVLVRAINKNRRAIRSALGT